MEQVKIIILISAVLLAWSLTGLAATKVIPETADKKKTPYSYAGKLFSALEDDGKVKISPLCSAQYYGAEDVLITAAHCVLDLTSNNVFYIHAYSKASKVEPSIKGTVKCMGTHSKYSGVGRAENDFALLKLNAKGGHGFLTAAKGIVDNEAITSIGYPSNFEEGKELLAVHGKRNKNTIYEGVQNMTGNSFDKGSSGGAWVNSKKQLVGINSQVVGTPNGPADTDNLMYSPIFGSEIDKLFDYVNGGCVGDKP